MLCWTFCPTKSYFAGTFAGKNMLCWTFVRQSIYLLTALFLCWDFCRQENDFCRAIGEQNHILSTNICFVGHLPAKTSDNKNMLCSTSCRTLQCSTSIICRQIYALFNILFNKAVFAGILSTKGSDKYHVRQINALLNIMPARSVEHFVRQRFFAGSFGWTLVDKYMLVGRFLPGIFVDKIVRQNVQQNCPTNSWNHARVLKAIVIHCIFSGRYALLAF